MLHPDNVEEHTMVIMTGNYFCNSAILAKKSEVKHSAVSYKNELYDVFFHCFNCCESSF